MFDSKDFLERIKNEDASMLKQMNILKEINKAGFITTESQAGRKQKGKHYLDNKPYIIEERAYITGFMLEKDAIKFIKDIGIYTDKNAVYVPICDDNIKIPASLDIPLTITTKAGKTEVSTHTSLALPKQAGDFFRKEAKLNKDGNIVYITCWDPIWNRLASGKKGLFTDVLHTLKNI
jgi:hypothetical protein